MNLLMLGEICSEKLGRMIEDIQQTDVDVVERSRSSGKARTSGWRTRELSAIEIAEGALLADIGVIFQLLIKYLPVGGQVLELLVPVIFAVLVLRRGFYVGCMSLSVALFITCIVVGPGRVAFLLLGSGAGIFLGVCMRYRLNHFTIILVGIVCGGLALWALQSLLFFLGGGPAIAIRTLHAIYAAFTNLFGSIFSSLNLGGWWQQVPLPVLNQISQWGFAHWPLFLLCICWLTCFPLVIGIYFVTNFFLRLLNYPVRPFPGYYLEGLFYWSVSGFFLLVPHSVLARRSSFPHRLKSQVRRLNIARLHQRRLEREAR